MCAESYTVGPQIYHFKVFSVFRISGTLHFVIELYTDTSVRCPTGFVHCGLSRRFASVVTKRLQSRNDLRVTQVAFIPFLTFLLSYSNDRLKSKRFFSLSEKFKLSPSEYCHPLPDISHLAQDSLNLRCN